MRYLFISGDSENLSAHFMARDLAAFWRDALSGRLQN